jgi:hypothetical protein
MKSSELDAVIAELTRNIGVIAGIRMSSDPRYIESLRSRGETPIPPDANLVQFRVTVQLYSLELRNDEKLNPSIKAIQKFFNSPSIDEVGQNKLAAIRGALVDYRNRATANSALIPAHVNPVASQVEIKKPANVKSSKRGRRKKDRTALRNWISRGPISGFEEKSGVMEIASKLEVLVKSGPPEIREEKKSAIARILVGASYSWTRRGDVWSVKITLRQP